MHIDISKIPEQGMKIQSTKGEKWFMHVLPKQENIIFSVKKAQIRCIATKVLKTVRIEGSIDAKAGLECCRCLVPFDFYIKNSFKYTYVPADERNDNEEEIELTGEDLDFGYYTDDTVDLNGLIIEQVILNIPIKPLCKELCKGLCPVCGINLNEKTCNHQTEQIDGPLAALKNLKLKK